MRFLFVLLSVTFVIFTSDAQSDKIASYSIKIPVSKGSPNTGGFRTDPFDAGGTQYPSIRVNLHFRYSPSTDNVIVLQTDGLNRAREVVRIRMSLVSVEDHQVVYQKEFEFPEMGIQEETVTIPVGERSEKYQLWFQDFWFVTVNGMQRLQGGSFMTWDGSLATVYRSQSTPNQETPAPQKPKSKYKVD